MSYQALYRKYRPKDFSSVKGQDHIVKTLTNQIQSDRVGHAYLFCGTRGTGKTTVAKIFAKAVNCENPSEKGPCGQCAMCKVIESQTSMNVIEIDAASNNGVDDVRQIIDQIQYSPAEGNKKVYIVDEVHMLSTSAFNALLKTLEEPPEYALFILATTDVHKLPATILSRCQRYDFKRISVDTIVMRLSELLDKEEVKYEKRALEYIGKQADGALRDALSLLEQCVSFYYGEKLTYSNVLKVLGAVDTVVYYDLLEAVVHQQVESVVAAVNSIVEQGKDLAQFTNEFAWYLRNLLVVKTTDELGDLVDLSEENIEELKQIAGEVEEEMIFRFIRVVSKLANDIKFGANKRVLFEVAMIRLCKPQMETDYDSLIQRMKNLEQMNEELQDAFATGRFSMMQEEPNASGGKPIQPEKVIVPDAVPEDVKQVVENWSRILHQLPGNSPGKAIVLGAKVSLGEENNLVLVFGDEVSYGYFVGENNDGENEETLKDRVEQIIAEVIGKKVTINAKYVETKQEYNRVKDLQKLFSDKIKIEMEE